MLMTPLKTRNYTRIIADTDPYPLHQLPKELARIFLLCSFLRCEDQLQNLQQDMKQHTKDKGCMPVYLAGLWGFRVLGLF